jgi:hypothetical protein
MQGLNDASCQAVSSHVISRLAVHWCTNDASELAGDIVGATFRQRTTVGYERDARGSLNRMQPEALGGQGTPYG